MSENINLILTQLPITLAAIAIVLGLVVVYLNRS